MRLVYKLVLGIIFIFLMISAIMQYLDYKNKLHYLILFKTQVNEEKEKAIKLSTQLHRLKDKKYLEKVIREKLNLSKKGEFILILPSPTPVPYKPTPTSVPHWRQWIETFQTGIE